MRIILRFFIKTMLILVACIILFIVGVIIFVNTAPQFGDSPEGSRLERIEGSSNYKEGQFVNLTFTTMDMDFVKGLGIMKEWIFNTKGRVPGKPLPVRFSQENGSYNDSSAYITWYGHSAVLLEIDNKRVLIDPMLGPASSPVSFMTKRFDYEEPIPIEDLTNIDIVVISHDHYDHLDYDTIKKIKDKVGHFYTPLGVGAHLEKWGVDPGKVSELDWWETIDHEGLTLVACPARHFSGRGFSDRNKTQWASWVIEGGGKKIYFSGDGGYANHFSEIGDKYGPFDFAMIECGQYNERWKDIHMMPEETVQAGVDLRSKNMMPIHWGAFNLALHHWQDPIERAVETAKKLDVIISTPFIGEKFEISDSPKEIWWE